MMNIGFKDAGIFFLIKGGQNWEIQNKYIGCITSLVAILYEKIECT